MTVAETKGASAAPAAPAAATSRSTNPYIGVLGVFLGAGVATLASVLLAASSLRVSGDYLLIASLGFQLGLLQVIRNFEWTGGPGGLTDIPATITGAARNSLRSGRSA